MDFYERIEQLRDKWIDELEPIENAPCDFPLTSKKYLQQLQRREVLRIQKIQAIAQANQILLNGLKPGAGDVLR